MNRHERRRARAMGAVEYSQDPAARAAYDTACETYFESFKAFVATARACGREPPLFAMLPDAMALAASLLDVGHRLARNQTAHDLVDLWNRAAAAANVDEPTYMMLRVFLKELRIATESVSLAELGLHPIGTSGAWGIN